MGNIPSRVPQPHRIPAQIQVLLILDALYR